MEICYHPYEFMATGGAIGDALFFFCSGFTILLGGNSSFGNYYKKRIRRIYPTVFVVAIITELFFMKHHDLWRLFVFGGGWFVTCIMIYYIPLYYIKRYGINYLWSILAFTFILSIAWYYLFFDNQGKFYMYYRNYYKWEFNFIFMLLGGIIGRFHQEIRKASWKDFFMLLSYILAWYAVPLLSVKYKFLIEIQYITLFPLAGCCFYFYKICTYDFWRKLYNGKITGQVLFVVGSVCLEAYLLQENFFTDKLNWLFPLNIPIIMLYVLIVSVIVKILSNVFMQTFQESDYDWKKCLPIKNH